MTINHKTLNNDQIVSASLAQRLVDFRKQAGLQSIAIGKHQWAYYAEGDPANEALLLLHGGGADAEAMFAYMQRFSQYFRVIAPNIPATLIDLGETTGGLRALLAHEGINRTIIVGVSFGAMLAQMYIRQFQDTVIDLVITHSLIPSKHLAEITKTQKNMIWLYPEAFLLWMSKRSYRQHIAMSSTPAPDSIKQFWQAYFDECYSQRIRKKTLIFAGRSDGSLSCRE